MSQADIEAGAQALRNYVASVDGWEANFVPWNDYEQGAQLVLSTWDDSSAPDATTYIKCANALYKTISDAGYGSQVTVDQCKAGAKAVLAATHRHVR